MTLTQKALEFFRFQYENNLLYHSYCNSLQKNCKNITQVRDIPFLPISFFKTQRVTTTPFQEEYVFSSSTSSGDIPSLHFVKHLKDYENSFLSCFQHAYFSAKEYCFLCLLPSYLERKGSSLVYMADYLIRTSQYKQSGFFLYNTQELAKQLQENIQKKIPTILLGVSFALLDFAEQFPMSLEGVIVMETGGMKGRRKEMLREDMHHFLEQQFQITTIHSEYGMTELFSQAYSKSNGIFTSNLEHLQAFIRPLDNPLETLVEGKGAMNFIDYNNRYSCAFIATDDIGEVLADGSFKILGRLDHTNIRGCNQMVL